ncbi:FeS-binding protein [Desulfovibrio sp.]|uniref:FeS-binding protein n=1 Tax=Desulfovibrio sp. TaxID=885 RepID=UPI0025B855DB|nr:FeS-binding protein [Desulfovibrio sp.]
MTRMIRSQYRDRSLFSGLFHMLWAASLAVAAFSGLAHLPFAVRYGLVDWDNRAPLWHYYAAAALLMLSTYAVIIWWRQGRKYLRLTLGGCLRAALLGVLILSGLTLVLHNLPDVAFFGKAYAVIKLCHLFCALILVPVLLVQICLRLTGRSPCLISRGASAAQGTQPSPPQGN